MLSKWRLRTVEVTFCGAINIIYLTELVHSIKLLRAVVEWLYCDCSSVLCWQLFSHESTLVDGWEEERRYAWPHLIYTYITFSIVCLNGQSWSCLTVTQTDTPHPMFSSTSTFFKKSCLWYNYRNICTQYFTQALLSGTFVSFLQPLENDLQQ